MKYIRSWTDTKASDVIKFARQKSPYIYYYRRHKKIFKKTAMTWKPFQQAVAGFDGLQNCDPDTVDCESTANDQNALVNATAEIEVQCGNGMNKII